MVLRVGGRAWMRTEVSKAQRSIASVDLGRPLVTTRSRIRITCLECLMVDRVG